MTTINHETNTLRLEIPPPPVPEGARWWEVPQP